MQTNAQKTRKVRLTFNATGGEKITKDFQFSPLMHLINYKRAIESDMQIDLYGRVTRFVSEGRFINYLYEVTDKYPSNDDVIPLNLMLEEFGG